MKNKKHIFKNKFFLTLLLSFFVLLTVISLPKIFIILDKKISYFFLKKHNQELSVNKDIVLLNLDDTSISKIWSFPFSREVYSSIIKNLTEKNAWIIAFDIILSDNWPSKKVDDELSQTIFKSNKVVLGSAIIDNWVESIVPPLNKFLTWGLNYWFFSPNINNISWEVYSFSPIKSLNITEKISDVKFKNTTKNFNHFTIEILKKYFKRDDIINNKNSFSIINWEPIPYSSDNHLDVLINYLPSDKFKNKLSLSDVYFKQGRFNDIDFENKIVLIWATAKWLKDIFNTPNWVDFWVYVHANIINTILSWKFLVYFDKNLEWLLITLIVLLSVYLNLSSSNKVAIIWNLVLFCVFLFLLSYLLSMKTWLMLNYPAHTIFAFILSITFSNIVKYFTENKDKKKMLGALSEYISKDIANEILNNSWNIKLEWQRKEISIFFSDIEGFTSISEKMDAWELVAFLREYLWAMSNIIMDERGFIDKYEWDAIMALWGVFWYESSSNYDNCNSALKQQRRLKKLNIVWKQKFGQDLKIRMWLNSWEAIVWNIGARGRKMEFTALWDAVNLASRLEEINKQYWTYICVSDTVYLEQKDNFEFRYLDKIRVKWKMIPTSIYELLSQKEALSDLKKIIVSDFEKAVSLYLSRDFKSALSLFEKLSNLWDTPSKVYITRCNMYLETPPDDKWDWVWTMKTK